MFHFSAVYFEDNFLKKRLTIKYDNMRQSHVMKQFMHSLSVSNRVCQPSEVLSTEAKQMEITSTCFASVDITFSV